VFDQGVVIDVPESLWQDSHGPGHAQGWEALLDSLVRYRPERPIDAIVLVIPARTLLERRSQMPAESQLSEVLFEKLRKAQQSLGLRLPIHLLVSGLDEIPGFNAYATALSPAQRDDAFGWANPYPLDTIFQETWVDEAVGSVHERLVTTSMGILAGRANLDDAEGIFRFPDRILAMQDELRSLLATIFRESAYHEGFVLRGIYFTGRVLEAAGEEPGKSQQAFISKLFEEKIFPERGLAVPFRSSLLDRNRKVRWLQIVTVLLLILGPLGVTVGHYRLSSNTVVLEDTLHRLQHGLALKDRATTDPTFSIAASGADDSIFVALSQIAELNHRNFRALWLPTSWLHTIDPLVDRTLTLGFQEAILPILRQSLLGWADTLSHYEWAATRGAPATGGAGTIPWSGDRVPEDGALVWYLREADSLNLNVHRFNTLVAQGDLDLLAHLVNWYFKQPLPRAMRNRTEFFEAALREARVPPIRPQDRGQFADDLVTISLQMAEVTYDDLLIRIEALDGAISAFASDASSSAGIADLDRLLQDLDRLERFLDRSEAWWLDPNLPMNPELVATLENLSDAGIFRGQIATTQLLRGLERIRTERLTQLEQLPSFFRVLGPAPLAITGSDNGLQLSPVLAQLSDGARDLLTRGFMRPLRDPGPSSPPAFGGRPRWDPIPLETLATLLGEAQAFRASGLEQFPVALQAAVRELIKQSLDTRTQEAVTAAMTTAPGPVPSGRREMEDELATRLANFDVAAQRLVRIMEIDQQSGDFALSTIVAQIVLMEMVDLLRVADQILDISRPYQVSMARWVPGQPANWAAFAVASADELEQNLAQQRLLIQSLADRHVRRILSYGAIPPVESLRRTGTDAFSASAQAQITRWEGLLRALDQYEAQEPGSPLMALERFIRHDMAVSGPGACPPHTVSPAIPATDWFGTVQDRIARAFLQRCAELASAQVNTAYDELRSFFNASLSGRFPFVAPGQARLAPDADPFSVQELLTWHTRLLAPLGPDAFALIRTLPGGEDAAQFLEQIEALRPVLESLLASSDPTVLPGIPFRVDFRTSRTLERGADQIAEWRFTAGDRQMELGQDESQRSGIWRPGQSVEFSLRWASGSPRRPLTDPQGGRVDGSRIVFVYDGPWALLRFMAVHAPTADLLRSASVGGGQPEPGSLLFVIPTGPSEIRAPAPEGTGSAELAIALIRLRLFDPPSGGIRGPLHFPLSAPPLGLR
jgi:type VI secretion system protein ImpL